MICNAQVQTLPRILYDNVLDRADLTPSSEEAEQPASNVTRWIADDYWQPENGSGVTLIAVLPAAESVNALTIGGHDLGSLSGTYQLEYSTDGGSTWNDAVPTTAPTTNAVIYRSFTAVEADRWRITISAANAWQVYMIGLGSDVELERGVWNGYSSPILSRKTIASNQRAPGPNFLGREREAEAGGSSLDLEWLSEDFVRGAWYTLQQACMASPFWLLWNPGQYPDEAAYCWLDGRFANPEITHTVGYHSATLPYSCMTEILTQSQTVTFTATGAGIAGPAEGSGECVLEITAFMSIGQAEGNATPSEGSGSAGLTPSLVFSNSYNSQLLGTL